MASVASATYSGGHIVSFQAVLALTLEEFCGRNEDDRRAITSCLEPKLSSDLKGALAPTMVTMNAKTVSELGEKLCMELQKNPTFTLNFGGDSEKTRAEFLTVLTACA